MVSKLEHRSLSMASDFPVIFDGKNYSKVYCRKYVTLYECEMWVIDEVTNAADISEIRFLRPKTIKLLTE